MKVTDDPVVVEQIIKTSIGRLWDAVTKVEEMKQWFFEDIESFKPEIGFETQFEVRVEDRTFTHLWRISEVIPHKKITYNWKYEEYPGDSFVTFELREEKNQVKLRLTADVVESFPDAIPEFSRDSCIQGWNYFIGKNLKEYLETNNT